MKKDEIILTIENLPTEIDGYKLFIYEQRILQPWGLICTQGKLNIKKLKDIFNSENEIKHYYFDNNLEFQFAIVYVKNEKQLFGETHCGSMKDCLTTVLKQIAEYKTRNK